MTWTKRTSVIPLAISEVEGSKIFYHDLFTNGIVYLDVGFDLHALPQELLPYVALFGRALVDMGTQKEDFVRLSQRIGRSTGGIWPALFTSLIRGTRKRGNLAVLAWKIHHPAGRGAAGDLAGYLADRAPG